MNTQDVPLLVTKLQMPPVRPGLVSRPRLLARLDEGLSLGRRLTLLSAPAGYGKTTLLSEWVDLRAGLGLKDGPRGLQRVAAAWLSLDEGDNDPVRFWSYAIAALQTVHPGLGESAWAALVYAPDPPDAWLGELINELAARPGRTLLVLDDLHIVADLRVHQGIRYLLDHLPAALHLVLSGRSDPPWPLARFRARGEMTELRLVDLRFTREEAAAYLNEVLRLGLSPGDVAALERRTEGWISGMYMAALSIRERQRVEDGYDASAWIDALSGEDRYILDYLIQEVLDRQPREVLEFLLRTSILEQFCAPLCDALLGDERPTTNGTRSLRATDRRPMTTQGCPPSAVCGPQSTSQAMLEQLDRANLFLLPLDHQRRWYRYHALFADLLRQRLREVHPDLALALHRRASVWFAAQGLIAEAVDHALSGGDVESAVGLIEGTAQATLMRGEVTTFLRWVQRLPGERVCARASLCLYYAWALLLSGRSLAALEPYLQRAGEDAGLVPHIALLRALTAVYRGETQQGAELARGAAEWLPGDDPFVRGIAAWIRGMAYMTSGDADAAAQALGEAARMSQEAGNTLVAVQALRYLAGSRIQAGRLYEAQAILEQALATAADECGRPLPIGGEVLMALGELSRQWNDLETAAHYLTEGIERTRHGRAVVALSGYLSLAQVRQAQGEAVGADAAIEEARQLALRTDATQADDLVVALIGARLKIIRGDVEGATRWAMQRGLWGEARSSDEGESDAVDRHMFRYDQAVLAWLLIVRGRPGEALTVLDRLLPEMEHERQVGLLIEIHSLQALAWQAQGDPDRALVALIQALSLAEPGGYVRTFLDKGVPMARLLDQAAARGIAPGYVARLLAATAAGKDDGSPGPHQRAERTTAPRSPSIVEPLSARELEVLALIAEGATNREVAQQLSISLNTVKGHTRKIYGKLGVHNRTAAVARASACGILSAD